jgi:hypothetical protein
MVPQIVRRKAGANARLTTCPVGSSSPNIALFVAE